jgi:hypothetical protein
MENKKIDFAMIETNIAKLKEQGILSPEFKLKEVNEEIAYGYIGNTEDISNLRVVIWTCDGKAQTGIVGDKEEVVYFNEEKNQIDSAYTQKLKRDKSLDIKPFMK